MRWPLALIGLLSWFTGGTLLAIIEIVQLPADPTYSTLLQLLPLLFLVGGIWYMIYQYQQLRNSRDKVSNRIRYVMDAGWIAVFGVNAGVASLNNFTTIIFRFQLPYYYQGVSLAVKVAALAGIFAVGLASIASGDRRVVSLAPVARRGVEDFSDKPVTALGFIFLLLGLVLGLAQYWPIVVYSGFFLFLTGAMLYMVGRLNEGNFDAATDGP